MHTKKTLITTLIIFFLSITCAQNSFAESFVGKKIFSLDLGYLQTGLENRGWGLGVNYEIQMFKFLSLRPAFSHMTLWPKETDLVVTTVGVKADVLFYPFFKGLDGPYIGTGMGTDFVMFSNSNMQKETAITVAAPIVGWKFSILDYVFIDPFLSYRILINRSDLNSPQVADYFSNKIKWGIKCKINLSKIFTK